MKRLHVHVGVEDLEHSIQFYSALFGEQPDKVKGDYARWMLEDPRINFAISTHVENGVDHLGLQLDEAEELTEVRGRIRDAEMATFDEGQTTCCYAYSDKTWVKDPSGVAWETYQTMEDAQFFSRRSGTEGEVVSEKACCA